MKIRHISLEEAGYFSTLFLDYVNHAHKVFPFYNYSPSPDSFELAIKDISLFKFNRELLAEVITKQYEESNCPLPKANSQLLSMDNTYTVCTGHQPCLFTGPLYFVYKIISSINLAEELKKKFSEYNFIPLYWMLGEDHDFEEINHIYLSGKKIQWKNKKGGAVGRYSTRGMEEVIENLKPFLGKSINAEKILYLFSEAYIHRKNLSDATRYLVNELFGKYGLLVLDADDMKLKNEFKEIIRDDILNHTNFKLVNHTITQLKSIGYEAQVIPKEINFFILSKNFRARINKTEVKKNPELWQKKVDTETERFSPNVVTRPLYQQKILPNIAYVGGPAEIAYWLEYKSMFDYHNIFYPVLIPRNFVHISYRSDSGGEISSKIPQERQENFIPFYLKYGQDFFEQLKQYLNPFDNRFIILSDT